MEFYVISNIWDRTCRWDD